MMAVDVAALGGLSEPATSNSAPLSWDKSPHWRQQQQLAQISRENSMPHSYARCAAVASKGASLPIPTAADLALTLAREDFGGTAVSPSGPLTPGKRSNTSFIEKREQREEERQRHINEDVHHQFWTSLDCSGQGFVTVSPKIMHYEFLQKLFLNHNNLREVPKCVTSLSQLRILDLSSNRLEELSPDIGIMSNLRVLLLFDNRLRTLPFELGSLFQLRMLGIEGNPCAEADTVSRNVFSSHGTRGLIEYLRDMAPVQSPPTPRKWMELNKVQVQSNTFSIMSYNTLCDQYATPQMYGYTPSWALSWAYRSQKLAEEVLQYDMDIICLQEVNTSALDELWLPVLEPRGYKLVFYPKTRARTMSKQSESRIVDGCATFYKSSKLKLIEKYPVEYNSKALLKDDLKRSVDIFNRVMTRDNIAIITVFKAVESGREIILANTHLHWDPAFRDVKLVQTALLLEETENMVRKYASRGHGNDLKKVPVLIAGDFNSDADSGVVRLFNHSSVPANHEDMAGHSYGLFTEEGIQHNLPLKSAYPESMQLPFTNYTPDFVEAIDYIVYSTPTFKVNALLGEVDREYAKHYVGFPNAHHPSDHIPIAVHLELI